MKNTMDSNKENKIKTDKAIISIYEICPVCGRYQPDGEVCTSCQKEHNIYEPKVTYIDGVQ